jgi:hypothetical protein
MKNIAVSTILLIACTAQTQTPPSDPDPISDSLPPGPEASHQAALSEGSPAVSHKMEIVDSTGPLIAWDFGLLQIGGLSPALALTVENNTDTVSDVLQVGLSGANADQFTLEGTDCDGEIQLAPGGTCSVRPRFSPSSSGAMAATLTIDGGVAGSASILLSGTGAPPAILSTQPYAFSFNVVEFGQPATETFTLLNSGVDIMVQSISVGGSLSGGAFSVASTTCVGALASNASCDITVEFNPQTFGVNPQAFGELYANLTVTTDHGPYAVGDWVGGWGGARLTVQTTGTGYVYSDSGFPAIACGTDGIGDFSTDCSGLFITPDQALAASGDLLSWGGACTGDAASCLLTLSTTETVATATFAQ